MAWSPGVALVVWEGATGVSGARIDAAGTPLDAAPFTIATGPSERSPAVASDGVSFLVVWVSASRLLAAIVSGQGALAGASPLVLSESADPSTPPALAWNGTSDFLVVWAETRGAARGLYGARVGAHGQVREPGAFLVSEAPGAQRAPAVASSHGGWLVAWADSRTGVWAVRGARVGGSGALLEREGFAIAAQTGAQALPAVASDGRQFLVVWGNGPACAPIGEPAGGACVDTSSVRGARVGFDGAVLDPAGLALAVGAPAKRGPDLAFDGTNFLVTWEESGGGLEQVLGRVVDPGGVMLGTVSLLASSPAGAAPTPTSDARRARVAASPAGSAWVAHAVYDPATGADRISAVTARDPVWLTVGTFGASYGTVGTSPALSFLGCAAREGADQVCWVDVQAAAPPTVVSLSAVPGPGSVFRSWGQHCSGTGDCRVTLHYAQRVDAVFTGSPCAAGLTRCAPACIDLQTDSSNCGRCENVCTIGNKCAAGLCVRVEPPM